MSFIAEIVLSKIQTEDRLHVSAAREKPDAASSAKARWVRLQHCNPGGARQDSVGAVFAWADGLSSALGERL